MSKSSNDRPDEPTSAVELTTSERHHLLANDRRRVVIDALRDQPVPIDLTSLARAVARRETDGARIDEQHVERVAVALHHVQLPKLAEFGVVEYDPATNCVESAESVPEALPR
jgi:hypothetical protein